MDTATHSEPVTISAGVAEVEGALELPEDTAGVVLFAHGSGSSRFSPRNNYVAAELRRAGLGTLLIDLLSQREDRDPATRFDIPLLARRLGLALDWLREARATRALPVGLFGASTGAGAALQLAAQRPGEIAAVVSRGGRPDMAGGAALAAISAPTLLIVGGLDDVVIDLNRTAYAALRGEKRLEIVEGATHLFEEPGTLEQVAALARDWLTGHLKK